MIRYNRTMLEEVRVVIVGMGLMGGSLARALRPHVASIVGVDLDAATRDAALADGTVDAAHATLDTLALTPDDLLVLATPVGAILETIGRLPTITREGCMLIDLGSTKWDICRAMNVLPGWFQAIGGHPMCGREVSGFGESSADLYRDKTFILTPTVHTTPHLRDLALELVAAIGARPVISAAQRA
jgi:prephenate dehydrogenase